MDGNKRKASTLDSSSSTVNVKVDDSYTPFLATFPGVTVSDEAVFQAFKGPKDQYILHGETDRLDYDGKNLPDEDIYYVGIYDPKTETISLSHAPVINASSSIKAYKKKEFAAIRQANVQNRLQRNALGEAFGTKRAKKAIGDLERNKIEVEKLESFTDSIVDNIKTTTASLPTAEALKEKQDSDRIIPICNEEAESASDIYPLSSLLSNEELSAIKVNSILRETDYKKKIALLPFRTSDYINSRVVKIDNEEHLLKLKLLFYASLLMGLYFNRRTSNKRGLLQKLNHPAEILVDNLITRFTDTRVGKVGKEKEASFVITPKLEDKLLCFLFATLLRIDEFTVEASPLATELSLKSSKVQDLFKALGSKIKPCTAAQKEALGLTSAEAANYKLATLSLPFKLPEVSKRKRAVRK
ncbi:RNA polymerase I associated factor, A49-like protein [Dipodascopsis uninucleata]